MTEMLSMKCSYMHTCHFISLNNLSSSNHHDRTIISRLLIFCLYPYLAVIRTPQDRITKCHLESLSFPQRMQHIQDALPGAFAEQRRPDISTTRQVACAFREIQMIDSPFLRNLTSYSRQFVGFQKEYVQIAMRIFIQRLIDLQSPALDAILTTFREKGFSLFRRQSSNPLLKSLEPIRQFHVIP